MSAPTSICLVSPAHLVNNPRVVKEATALRSAGYEVTIIYGQVTPRAHERDRALIAAHGLRAQPVNFARSPGAFPAEAAHRLARLWLRRSKNPSWRLAARAEHRATCALAKAAAAVAASLYIGHMPAGLAAVATAAERTNARFSFDAEDFHSAETDHLLSNPAAQRGLDALERTLLSRCASFTAAAPLIADAYAESYGCSRATTVLNVFPRAMAPTEPVLEPDSNSKRPRLYWFSQTIGPGRGLEGALTALAAMRTTCDLVLRGDAAEGYLNQLRVHASSVAFRGEVVTLPTAAPDEMARLASEYDLGLGLEERSPRNRDLCLTNKVFTYLLAGLPQALTPTRAQRQLAGVLGPASLEIDLAQPMEAARTLDDYFSSRDRQRAARVHAWHLGQTRYNWDYEQQHLLASVASALSTAQPTTPTA